MRIALGSDERTPLTDAVAEDLADRGHELVLVGPPGGQDDKQWAEVGRLVGWLVAEGHCQTGVLFCWTGTGASIAANIARLEEPVAIPADAPVDAAIDAQ